MNVTNGKAQYSCVAAVCIGITTMHNSSMVNTTVFCRVAVCSTTLWCLRFWTGCM